MPLDGPPDVNVLDAIAWPARTARLTLRPASIADAEAIRAYRRLPEVYRWLRSAPDDADSWRRSLAGKLSRTLVIEREGRVIGDLMLRVQDSWAQDGIAAGGGAEAELGWVLDPAESGIGYATEAATVLLRLCFESLHLHRVFADCFAGNEPSWRLMERIGMRREAHHVASSLHRDLGWVDDYLYALLADEWRALRRPPHRE